MVFYALLSPCQSSPDAGAPSATTNAVPHSDNHIFGIIPNFRTSPMLVPYKPISPREKFRIFSQDSFDRGTFLLAAAFAGESQLSNSNRSFGQGVEGYSKYLGGAYADFVIGNFMTEGVLPTILHQDPRSFAVAPAAGGPGWATRWGRSSGRITIRAAQSLTTLRSWVTQLPWRSRTSTTKTNAQPMTRFYRSRPSWAST